jgi:hypothetical protein
MMRFASLFLLLLGAPHQEPHPLKHRILWTWDTWICDDDPDGRSYLAEYKDLVDWMSKNEYTGLIVWGFVDGRHGGEAAAKELSRYARSKGIALLPGVSTGPGAFGSYGGFVLGLPGHPFSDETALKASTAGARPGEAGLCYARPETREWLRKGTEWLLSTFDVDGVNLETAEEGIGCGCADCKARLAAQGGPTGGASFSDLSICVPIVADVFRKARKEPLVTYAAYRPLWWEQKAQANDLLGLIPEACVAQWNLELSVHEAPAPVKHNVALLHGGGWSYHLRRRAPSRWAFTQSRCFYPKLDDIRRFAANVRKMNFEGFVAGNAGSPKNPDAELAYLAFTDFTRDPAMTVDAFLKKHLPRLYGEAAAEDVARLILAQPAVHEKALPYWKAYEGRWPEGGDAKEAASTLAAQVVVAKAASMKASADGKRRLDGILPILEEYRIICEAAAAGIAEKAKLAEAYDKAGLPDDLYGYKAWK